MAKLTSAEKATIQAAMKQDTSRNLVDIIRQDVPTNVEVWINELRSKINLKPIQDVEGITDENIEHVKILPGVSGPHSLDQWSQENEYADHLVLVNSVAV